ncbi:MAG TPA: DNA repair protein RadA [Alphaproteobacteria bacterium]
MAKRSTTQYVCQQCGATHSKWSGQCNACMAWNTLVEETISAGPPKGLGNATSKNRIHFVALKGEEKQLPRRMSRMEEFDRVCGGGLVPGSATLIGGDPGIGKSTLLLQVLAHLADNHRVAYISGEEAIDQVRLRATRLGLRDAKVDLAAATNVGDIIATLKNERGENAYDVVVIDSIQTMYLDNLDSAPGTVAQVRASAAELIRLAKQQGFSLLLVGHVTKEGTIAGPRVLEHMVDTVLYFEGERGHAFRILRGVKNRFGATDEIGVFEMTDKGLSEVKNPSALFLADRQQQVSGSVVFAGIEGTRPVLVEIQALVAPSAYGTPRRAVIGWDAGRLAMVIAVLETRAGLQLGGRDIYLNVAGGLRITEPAADLAVAAALVSALDDTPFPSDAVVFGELALSGEIRPVSQLENRVKEAGKLGFAQAFIPPRRGKKEQSLALPIQECDHLLALLRRIRPKNNNRVAQSA